jgi:hypothetical protein
MAKISATALKKHLTNQSQEQLIKQIIDLSSTFANVNDYYQQKINPQSKDEIILKYKATIEHEFFPKRGHGKLGLAAAKKAISEYKKTTDDIYGVIDLMLFYVEQGVKFINEYGDIKESFYYSGEAVYDDALKLMTKHHITEFYEVRCKQICRYSSHTGYGFGDSIKDIYDEVFSK